MDRLLELNLDALVGPTHAYGGLSLGNLAATRNRAAVSHPRAAALQGIAKMRLVASLGAPVAVLPPQPRPGVETLRRMGFAGTDPQVIAAAYAEDPALVAAVSSSSFMWAANAATVAPSVDADDGRVHFTVANLVTQFHRSLEPPATARMLAAIFPDRRLFAHAAALPAHPVLADEGAANHTRLSAPGGAGPGVHLFVHGTSAGRPAGTGFPARQTLEASRAVARLNGVAEDRAVHLRQSARAIEAGAFHNDVVAIGVEDVLLHHEAAWESDAGLREAFERVTGARLTEVTVTEAELPLAEAISTYLFNSLLLPVADGSLVLVAPAEVQESAAARAVVERVTAECDRVSAVRYIDVRQSMRNGGGPACLRLRVPLTVRELAGVHAGVLLTDSLATRLERWVTEHYRESLTLDELRDPQLAVESSAGLSELGGILRLADRM